MFEWFNPEYLNDAKNDFQTQEFVKVSIFVAPHYLEDDFLADYKTPFVRFI